MAAHAHVSHQGPNKVGLIDAYCSPYPSTPTLENHTIYTGGRTDIVGDNGMPVLQCKRRGLTSDKDFCSNDGKHIFTLTRHSFSRKGAYTLDNLHGIRLAQGQRHAGMGKAKLDLHFKNALGYAGGHNVTFEIRLHGWTGRVVTIRANGSDVASVERKGRVSTGWKVQIMPGIDQSLIAAIVVMLDQIRKQQQASAASSAGGAGGGS